VDRNVVLSVVAFVDAATAFLLVALVVVLTRRLARQPGVLPDKPGAPNVGARLGRLDRQLYAAVALWVGLALFFTLEVWTPPSAAIALYIFGLAGVAYVAITRTATGRALLAAIPAHWLIGAQVYRVIGGGFLIAAAYGVVPAYFAIPAGWGDILVGISALVVAALLATNASIARPAAWTWNALGLLDLVVAVGIGSGLLAQPAAAIWGGSPYWLDRAAAGFDPLGASIFPISFPQALIPTLIVPLSVLLHILSIRTLIDSSRRKNAAIQQTKPAIRNAPEASAA
jgi:hypothetical protein